MGCMCSRRDHLPKTEDDLTRLIRRLYSKYKDSARHREIEFHLTVEQVGSLIVQNCYYCGRAPKTKINKAVNIKGAVHGIDRKNNNVGYLIENCAPACSNCNLAKRCLEPEEFIHNCFKVYMNKKLIPRLNEDLKFIKNELEQLKLLKKEST